MVVEKIRQKDWNYTFYKSADGFVISVVCGGVAMYELNIPLSAQEIQEHVTENDSLDLLANKIRTHPNDYSTRSVPIVEGKLAKSGPKRVPGGERCPQTGYWFTPASKEPRRHFNAGDIFPKIESDYGSTFWQWSPNQKD